MKLTHEDRWEQGFAALCKFQRRKGQRETVIVAATCFRILIMAAALIVHFVVP